MRWARIDYLIAREAAAKILIDIVVQGGAFAAAAPPYAAAASNVPINTGGTGFFIANERRPIAR